MVIQHLLGGWGEPTLVPGSACAGGNVDPNFVGRSPCWALEDARERGRERAPSSRFIAAVCASGRLWAHVRPKGSPRGWGRGRSCWAGSFPHSLSQASRATVPRGSPRTVLGAGELTGPHPASPGRVLPGSCSQNLAPPPTCSGCPDLLQSMNLQGLGGPCSLWSRDTSSGNDPPCLRPPQLRNCDFTFSSLC